MGAHVEGRPVLVLLPRRLPVAGAKDEGGVRPEAPDASDLRSLEEAKRVAREALRRNGDLERGLSARTGPLRAASSAAAAAASSVSLRQLCSIRRNVLFRACAEEELRDHSAASDEARFAVGAVVIRQGDGATSSVSSRRGRSTSWRRPQAPIDPFPNP